MMLPEHVELLRRHEEGHGKSSKPFLDEQQYNEFNELILEAMEVNRTLEFSYYDRGSIKQFVGSVHYFDEIGKELRIFDLDRAIQG
ncbi:YolD-like family protein [Pseudalkalibacillus sp. A8]|uniref:YolD-like family protein n=1 Tax=Pseudalkalibacillus sp. A8 TaxID=3382641 RepID=UPI0038B62356